MALIGGSYHIDTMALAYSYHVLRYPYPYTTIKLAKPHQPKRNVYQLQDLTSHTHTPQNPRHIPHAKELQEKPQKRGTQLNVIETPIFFCEEFYRGVPQRSVYADDLKFFFY